MDAPVYSSTPPDVYAMVTERIIALLEKGTIPWRQPWKEGGLPRNASSKRAYRGVNLWLLLSLPYEKHLYLTWDQIKQMNASVKQGEHGHIVLYWKVQKKTAEEKEAEDSAEETPTKQKTRRLLRYYKVFNVSQCTNLPEKLLIDETASNPKAEEPIAACDLVIEGMPKCPLIRHKEAKAYYHIANDYINMPKKKSFDHAESYYSVLFHELVHSTGNEIRLNRATLSEMAAFGSESYSIEELVAELGTSYLSFTTGILLRTIENSASYIASWLKQLKNDKKFIVKASGLAQQAVDYILNVRPETADAVAAETAAAVEESA